MRITIKNLTIETGDDAFGKGGKGVNIAPFLQNFAEAIQRQTVDPTEYEEDDVDWSDEAYVRDESAEAKSASAPVDSSQEAYSEQLQAGSTAMQNFVDAWIVGFGCPVDDEGTPEVEQPDRLKLVQKWMATDGKAILAYIASQGGLRAAVRSVISLDKAPDDVMWKTPEGYQAYCDEVAGNIVQIASIVTPVLADTIEYTHEDSRG